MITIGLQQSFLEARTALPSFAKCEAEVIVVSSGEHRGQWSAYHVFCHHETLHFVFFKNPVAKQWVCAHTKLQQWLVRNNEEALQLLQSFIG